jgi:sarcosine oxidase subunit beta
VIVGGGGHGLATAYYLAKEHGLSNIAVIEKGWIGSGNAGRNTTIIRSNYREPGNQPFYEFSMKLWEGLEQDLNYNSMVSQRGVLNLCHSDAQRDAFARRGNAMILHGADAELLDEAGVRRLAPFLDFHNARYPIRGGLLQRRGGTARHDAVVWGYARAAAAFGVDIVEGCEATGFLSSNGRVAGVVTNRGEVRADRVALCVAGRSTVLAGRAGFELPITSYGLQAFVTEPVKPVLDVVALSTATGAYLSQSDKGGLVIGGALDLYPSYAQRGGFATARKVLGAVADQFPSFGQIRLLRQWAGIVDVTHDSSPILGAAPVPGLYLNCGWGTGGFKAIPAGGWLTAHQLATGETHDIARPFTLERFVTGRLLDEAAASGIAH